jgi:hypothetical protein
MKNKAFIFFVISILFFCIGMQKTQGAWWGRTTFAFLWRLFWPIFISFIFSALAFFKSILQIRHKQYNPALNWVALIGGMLLAFYTGIISVGLARSFL